MAVVWQGTPPEHLLETRFHITTGFYPGQRDSIRSSDPGQACAGNSAYGLGEASLLPARQLLLPSSHVRLFAVKGLYALPGFLPGR